MGQVSGKLRQQGPGAFAFWCPGCEKLHGFGPGWTFDGNVDKPTVSPSIKVVDAKPDCHLFLSEGNLQFLSDCSHPLAGQTVPLPDLPDWLQD